MAVGDGSWRIALQTKKTPSREIPLGGLEFTFQAIA
jgi:hypothetical protein